MIVERILEGKRYIEIDPQHILSEVELAYLAGIIDGEGSIFIAKESKRLAADYMLRLSVTSTDKVLIDWIHRRFGGNVCRQRRPIGKWKLAYHWRASGPHAMRILEATNQFLVLKRLKADFAIAFQQRKQGIGVHPLPPEKAEEYRWFKAEVSDARCY